MLNFFKKMFFSASMFPDFLLLFKLVSWIKERNPFTPNLNNVSVKY